MSLIEKIKRLPQTEETLTDLFALLQQGEPDRSLLLWIRSHALQIASPSMYDLVYKTYVVGARNGSFDDFMIAVEWDRPAKERFWLPRRSKLLHVAQALQELADDELDELFISMPPRIGKTTIVQFFSLYQALRDPEKSNLYCSYSDTVVKAYYTGMLEILCDPLTYKWREVFPDRTLKNTNANDLTLDIDRKKRYSTFTCRSLYGTLNGACDCNGIEIADDLHSGIEEAVNPDRLNAAWMKVYNNLLPRAKQTAKNLWIGTRWAQEDCIGIRMQMLESDDRFKAVRYKALIVPALDENNESNFDYDYNVGYNTAHYLQVRASAENRGDTASWLAQYQCSPIDRIGAAFSYEQLRYYNGVLLDGQPDKVCFVVDVAWGGTDSLSMPIAYVYGEDVYIHDWLFDSSDKDVTRPRVIGKILGNKCQTGRFEANNGGHEYADIVSSKLRESKYVCNISSAYAPAKTSKLARIQQFQGEIRNFYFRSPNCRDADYNRAMNELNRFSFTSKNKHDDSPDSLAMLADFIFHGVKYVTTGKRFC